MYDTVKMLIESSVLPKQDFVMKNHANFSELREATENEILATRYTLNKVPVTMYDGKYVMEFSNGIEQVMEEYNYDLATAVEEVARTNKIPVRECVLVVDESAITRVDLSDMNFQLFETVRK